MNAATPMGACRGTIHTRVIYGVLLWADMNAATPMGAWGRSVISSGAHVHISDAFYDTPDELTATVAPAETNIAETNAAETGTVATGTAQLQDARAGAAGATEKGAAHTLAPAVHPCKGKRCAIMVTAPAPLCTGTFRRGNGAADNQHTMMGV